MKMKVLHVIDRSFPGGAEIFLWQLVKKQAKTQLIKPYVVMGITDPSYGYNVNQLLSTPKIFNILLGRKGYILYYLLWGILRTSNDPLAYYSLKKVLKQISPDIVHFHTIFQLSSSVFKATKVLNIPSVFTLHDYSWICPSGTYMLSDYKMCDQNNWNHCIENCRFNKYEYFFKRFIRKRITENMINNRNSIIENNVILVSQTDVMKESLINLGYDKKNIKIVNSGVDVDMFKPIKYDNLNRDNVISVCRLHENKGIKNYISLARYYKNNYDHDLKFGFIGGDLLSKYVVSHKWIDRNQLPSYYNKSLAFIHLGNTMEGGGLGLSTLEAMACGTVAISYNIPGASKIISNGIDGYLFERNDYEGIVNKLLELKEDKNLRDNISKKAREKIVNRYNLNMVEEKYYNIYNDML